MCFHVSSFDSCDASQPHQLPLHPAPQAAPHRRAAKILAAGTAVVLTLTACGSTTSGSPTSGSSTSSSATGADQPADITFALDWAPNTNHIGVYVAQELGYFDDAGLDVEILPYGSTNVLQLVSAGEADFGIGSQSSVQMARTAGLDVISVLSATQTDAGRLVTMESREDITRPKNLDGKIFGGFGSPLYAAIVKKMITADGGTGEFTEVSLDTGSYEALSQGKIDFTLSVSTWEDVQGEIENRPYRAFRYQDYGVPDQHSLGIVSSDAFLSSRHDDAAAFVQAVARGFDYAAKNPKEAADLLIQANPDTLGTAEELVHRSTELLASEFFVSEDRPVGATSPKMWENYGSFLFNNGILVDKEGKPLTEEPDWSEYFTNEFVG
ncbi:MAG: ABC transporter substrate-binding protein [Ancrocorticia sp.]